jgi:hypothetical protein
LQADPIDEPQLAREDVLHAPVLEVVRGAWFCSNAECVLHVRVGDAGVVGHGEWAVRPDAVVTSRAMYAGRMLCDVCGRSSGLTKSGGKS